VKTRKPVPRAAIDRLVRELELHEVEQLREYPEAKYNERDQHLARANVFRDVRLMVLAVARRKALPR
jgi:hypothetical protein